MESLRDNLEQQLRGIQQGETNRMDATRNELQKRYNEEASFMRFVVYLQHQNQTAWPQMMI